VAGQLEEPDPGAVELVVRPHFTERLTGNLAPAVDHEPGRQDVLRCRHLAGGQLRDRRLDLLAMRDHRTFDPAVEQRGPVGSSDRIERPRAERSVPQPGEAVDRKRGTGQECA
jgi:hypothetical protein